MTTAINLKQLYEIDDCLWLEETIDLLKHKHFNELDLENLIEELEDLGKEKKNAASSLLEQIIRHSLLCQYWKAESATNMYHWQAEIYSFRKQLNRKLTINLSNYLQENLDNIYQDALEYVQRKTNYTVNFPEKCPYNLEQLLDINWLN